VTRMLDRHLYDDTEVFWASWDIFLAFSVLHDNALAEMQDALGI
jgi:hypothetical protein